MKKCPWCGQEYPDEVSLCAIDQYPLEPRDPVPAPEVARTEKFNENEPPSSDFGAPRNEDEETSEPSQNTEDEGAPDGFQILGAVDPFEAEQLLKRFSDSNIRFEIERIEQNEQGRKADGRRINYIRIFVHNEDYEKAWQILTEDWKV